MIITQSTPLGRPRRRGRLDLGEHLVDVGGRSFEAAEPAQRVCIILLTARRLKGGFHGPPHPFALGDAKSASCLANAGVKLLWNEDLQTMTHMCILTVSRPEPALREWVPEAI